MQKEQEGKKGGGSTVVIALVTVVMVTVVSWRAEGAGGEEGRWQYGGDRPGDCCHGNGGFLACRRSRRGRREVAVRW